MRPKLNFEAWRRRRFKPFESSTYAYTMNDENVALENRDEGVAHSFNCPLYGR